MERLDLGPEVREPVYAILDGARAEHRELRAKVRQAHAAMRELMAAEAPDPEAVMAQADRLGALHTEMHKHKLRTLLEVREQIGSDAWAQLHAHRHPRRGPPPLERVLERHAERLGLDDDTRARIREIAEEARAGSEPLHDELHRLRAEMRSRLSAEAPDEERVMALAGEIGEVETRLRRHRLRTMLRIRALLTPAQRAALVELHRERHRRHEGHGPPDD